MAPPLIARLSENVLPVMVATPVNVLPAAIKMPPAAAPGSVAWLAEKVDPAILSCPYVAIAPPAAASLLTNRLFVTLTTALLTVVASEGPQPLEIAPPLSALFFEKTAFEMFKV